MTILYRTAGAWGSGLGRKLTKAEVDGNFYTIAQELASLNSSIPTAARGIDHVTSSANTFSLVMTDASTEGPFTLPVVTNPYRGVWAPSTAYLKYQRFTRNGNLYEVLFPHTSALTFDAAANDGVGDDYYMLILSNPGASLPGGGATGAFMVKASSADYDFTTLDPGSLSIPASAISSGTLAGARIPVATGSVLGGVKILSAVSHKWLNSIGSDGVPVASQPSFADISGILDVSQLPSSGSSSLTSIPMAVQSLFGGTTLDNSYSNIYVRCQASITCTITVPNDATAGWVPFTEISFYQVGPGNVQIVAGSGVTLNIPVGYQAKALTNGSVITIKHVNTNQWDVFGLLLPSP